jgi:hypothetical protein
METRKPGHETRDVNVTKVTLFGLGLMAVVIVSVALMAWLFDYLAGREAASQPQPATLTARPAAQLPPEPRLQANPAADLAQMRAEEDRQLRAYGWVDRGAGLARIPVDEAMEIVVRKGLK